MHPTPTVEITFCQMIWLIWTPSSQQHPSWPTDRIPIGLNRNTVGTLQPYVSDRIPTVFRSVSTGWSSPIRIQSEICRKFTVGVFRFLYGWNTVGDKQHQANGHHRSESDRKFVGSLRSECSNSFTVGIRSEIYSIKLTVISDQNPIWKWLEVYGCFSLLLLRSEYGRRHIASSRRSSPIGIQSENGRRFTVCFHW